MLTFVIKGKEGFLMKKPCILKCGHLVGGGGNRHANGHCPPLRREHDPAKQADIEHERRKRAKKHAEFVPARGVAVAGTSGSGVKGNRPQGAKVPVSNG